MASLKETEVGQSRERKYTRNPNSPGLLCSRHETFPQVLKNKYSYELPSKPNSQKNEPHTCVVTLLAVWREVSWESNLPSLLPNQNGPGESESKRRMTKHNVSRLELFTHSHQKAETALRLMPFILEIKQSGGL